MQRKQLEEYYDVKIYRKYWGYILVLPEGDRAFMYISDIEDFLDEREKNERKQER